jgi:hypothetical protein
MEVKLENWHPYVPSTYFETVYSISVINWVTYCFLIIEISCVQYYHSNTLMDFFKISVHQTIELHF